MDKKKLLQLAKAIIDLEKVETEQGILVTVDAFEVGADVLFEDGSDVPDGEYVAENKKVTVKDGKIEELEVIENETQLEEQPETEPVNEPAEDERDLKIKELEGLLADRDAIIEQLTQKIKELEDAKKVPVEESININKTEQQYENKNIKTIKDKFGDIENPALKFFKE